MDGKAEFDFNVLFPPVINDANMNEIVKSAADKLECINGITVLPHAAMTGDDFSYFSQKVQGAYFKLGVGNTEIDAIYPLHSPKFRADDNALPIGAAMMAQIVVEYLND